MTFRCSSVFFTILFTLNCLPSHALELPVCPAGCMDLDGWIGGREGGAS